LVLKALLHARKMRPDVVVVINVDALVSAPLLLRHCRASLVYYALEYTTRPEHVNVEKARLRNCVDCLIDVEETRLAMRLARAGADMPAVTLWNAPRSGLPEPKGEALTQALIKTGVDPARRRVLLYSGSYQRCASLEHLVSWAAANLDASFLFVLLITGEVPDTLLRATSAAPRNVCLLRGVPPDRVLDYVKDATVALLPYCDEEDPNVCYCSPQKLFDCLVCGVPFVGSQRPLVQRVAADSGAGVCTDIMDAQKLLAAVRAIADDQSTAEQMGRQGRAAYLHMYNFDFCAAKFADWLQEARAPRRLRHS
jgi:glycosyltransferase involved in cell wall biosynthesis